MRRRGVQKLDRGPHEGGHTVIWDNAPLKTYPSGIRPTRVEADIERA